MGTREVCDNFSYTPFFGNLSVAIETNHYRTQENSTFSIYNEYFSIILLKFRLRRQRGGGGAQASYATNIFGLRRVLEHPKNSSLISKLKEKKH